MRMVICFAMMAVLVGLVGCTVMPMNAPVAAVLTIDVKGPIAVGDTNAQATKVGRAKAQGILIVAYGDASISAAAKSVGITRIHHVDTEVLSILGIYARSETIVYGE